MPELKVSYNKTTRTAHVFPTAGTAPSGSVEVGTFNHPDITYPDSYVVYHGVRELLYKRSAANPAQTAKFPDNITDMQRIKIDIVANALQ